MRKTVTPAFSFQNAGVFFEMIQVTFGSIYLINSQTPSPRLCLTFEKLLSWPMRKTGSFSFFGIQFFRVSKIFIVLGSVRTIHRKLTITDVNNLGASDVFASATTTPWRLLNRIYTRVSAILEYQVLHSHYTDVTAITIKH